MATHRVRHSRSSERRGFLKKAWQKLLNNYSGFVGCRQSVSDLTAGEYSVGTFGLNRGASAGEWRNQRLRAASFGLCSGAAKRTDSLGADLTKL